MRDFNIAKRKFREKYVKLGFFKFVLKSFEVVCLNITSKKIIKLQKNKKILKNYFLDLSFLKENNIKNSNSLNLLDYEFLIFGKKFVMKSEKPLHEVIKNIKDLLDEKSYNELLEWSKQHYSLSWNKDCLTGEEFNEKIIKYNKADIKYVWEFGRFATHPSESFNTQNLKLYANRFMRDVVSFYAENNKTNSIQWCNAMEAGIRITNLITCYSILKWRGFKFPNWFDSIFISGIDMHKKYILMNLEYSFVQTSNHYTCNLMGLTAIYAFTEKKIYMHILKFLTSRDLKRNVSFGLLHEGSTAYHRFTTEVYVAIMFLLKSKKILFSTKNKNVVIDMIDLCINLKRPDGLIPLFGDSDGGYINFNIVGYSKKYNIHTPYCVESFLKHIYWCNVFNKKDFIKSYNAPKYLAGKQFFIINDTENYLCINMIKNPPSHINKTHYHNDFGFFELFNKGKAICVDAGSPYYTKDFLSYSFYRSSESHLGFSEQNNLKDFFSDITRDISNFSHRIEIKGDKKYITLYSKEQLVLKIFYDGLNFKILDLNIHKSDTYFINYDNGISLNEYL